LFDGEYVIIDQNSEISFTSVDTGKLPSGVNRIEYRMNDGDWVNFNDLFGITEPGILKYRSIDNVGNTEAEQSIFLQFDDQAPSTDFNLSSKFISPNNDQQFDEVTFGVNISDNFSSQFIVNINLKDENNTVYNIVQNEHVQGRAEIVWNGRYEGNMLAEGTYKYEVEVSDANGNISEHVEGEIIIDITPPSINLIDYSITPYSVQGNDHKNVLSVDYHVQDNFSNNVHIDMDILTNDTFSIFHTSDHISIPPNNRNISWSGLNNNKNKATDSLYNFRLKITDEAGNKVETSTFQSRTSNQIRVDNVVPITHFSVNGPYFQEDGFIWIAKDSRIVLGAEDMVPGSGISKTYYSILSENYLYTQPITIINDTPFELSYYSEDHIGNVEAKNSIQLQSDIEEPSIELNIGIPKVEKDNSIFVSPLTPITLTASDQNGSGINNSFIKLCHIDNVGVYEKNVFLTDLNDGEYCIEYWSEDRVKNTSDKNKKIINLDQTPPQTNLNIQGKLYSDEGKLYITAESLILLQVNSNNDDVKSTYYKIDNATWNESNQVKLSKDGKYSVSYYSQDLLENNETENTKIIVVDNLPPSSKINIQNNAVLTPLNQITLSARDVYSGVKQIKYSIDGSPFVDYDKKISLSSLASGNHEIQFQAIDNLEHKEKIQKYSFNIIDITLEISEYEMPRVLVYLLQTHDLYPQDKRPNADLIEGILSNMHAYYTITDKLDDFIDELRSDKYMTYILVTDAYTIDVLDSPYATRIFRELASRVHKGDTLFTMFDYSDVYGDALIPIQELLSTDIFMIEGLLDKNDLEIIPDINTYRVGKGHIIEILNDLGRESLISEEYEHIKLTIQNIINKIRPMEEHLNVGEIIDLTIHLKNNSSMSAQLHLEQVFPSGSFIETYDSSGEIAADSNFLSVNLTPYEEYSTSFLYRLPLQKGSNTIMASFSTLWENDISFNLSKDKSIYINHNSFDLLKNIVNVDDSVIESESEIFDPLLQITSDMLENSGIISEQDDLEAQIDLILDTKEALRIKYPEKSDLQYELDELLESIEISNVFIQKDEQGIDSDMSHFGTVAYSQGGGCSIMQITTGYLFHFLILISVYYILRKRKC